MHYNFKSLYTQRITLYYDQEKHRSCYKCAIKSVVDKMAHPCTVNLYGSCQLTPLPPSNLKTIPTRPLPNRITYQLTPYDKKCDHPFLKK